ncbi:hypothetical protein EKK58_04265 [Candidatus Dependentiae bacterium]|nr:MAG: hypothetical protein EKK58_04265 [Candidatus Dependentiae bacterium]
MTKIIAIHFKIDDDKYNTSQKRLNFIRNKIKVEPIKQAHRTTTMIKYRINNAKPKEKHYTKKIDNVNIIFEQSKGKKIAGSILDVLKNPADTFRQIIHGVDQFSNMSKETINKYGNDNINAIRIARTPLNKVLDKTIDALSFGKFGSLVKKEGYNTLYHLSLILSLSSGERLIYEKNEVVYIHPVSQSSSLKPNTQYMDIPVNKKITLNEFINNAIKYMGEKNYFQYRSLTNNCQNFIENSLKGSGLADAKTAGFIFQDMSNIRKEMNKTHGYFEKLLNGVTETGARASVLMGKGIDLGDDKVNEHLLKHSKNLYNIISSGNFKYL